MRLNDINARTRGDRAAFVRQADERLTAQLSKVVADILKHREDRPIVLLSGPSGSGKTTTAQMLEAMLDSAGCETHTLSTDHFFSPLSAEDQRRMAEGKLDLESPDRVDVSFLNEQLAQIVEGRPIHLPKFDFVTNTRRFSKNFFTRRPGELLILEGIHALNPRVITLPDEETTRLYVSVRTRVSLADGRVIHPKIIRLMRRMLRDNKFRGRSFEETIRLYHGVQQGEDRYIMPYKGRSSYDVDTFVPYEVGAYRPFLLSALDLPGEEEPLAELKALLREAETFPAEDVPEGALIREFLGGGIFKY